MDDQVKRQLREAYALIKDKKRQEAVGILLPILQTDEDNADAWWLLANCLDDPQDVREALDNVLRLRPDHDKAQIMLNAIEARYPRPEPEPEPEPDAFDFDDSISAPFAGADFEAAAGETAAPFEGYNEADLGDVSDIFPGAEDPFAVGAGKRPGTGPFTEGSFSEAAGEGDPFALAEDAAADPFGPAESFGPVETFGAANAAPARDDLDDTYDPFGAVSSDADPFGDPFEQAPAPAPKRRQTAAKPAQRKARPAASKDPFGAGETVGAPARGASRAATKSKGGGTNPLVLLLAIIGGIALIACIGCGVLSLAAPAILANVGGQVMQQFEVEGFAATLEAAAGGNFQAEGFVATLEAAAGGSFEGLGSSNVSSAINRGSLSYGDSRRDTLNPGEQHAWTFSGNSGDRVLIEMQSTASDGLDAYLSLFNASGSEIAFDDDSGSDYNARLEHTLPAGGTYTVVARTFGFSGGSYQITLNRR